MNRKMIIKMLKKTVSDDTILQCYHWSFLFGVLDKDMEGVY